MRSELRQEYTELRERWKSAQRGIKIHDIPQLKLSLKCAREFLQRWQHKRHELAVERTLAELRDQNRRILAVLENWFREALHSVIDRRVRWLIAEHRFRFSVEYIGIVQNARRDLQAQLQSFFFDEFGYEFDPERVYRQAEAVADRCERDYKKAFSALNRDWPEYVNPQLLSRLAATDPLQLRSWKATLPTPIRWLG